MVSGLLLRSLQRTLHANLGFDPDRILAVDLNLPAGEYEGRDSIANFYGPVLTRVGALPGVAGVGLTNMLAVRESGSNSDIPMQVLRAEEDDGIGRETVNISGEILRS